MLPYSRSAVKQAHRTQIQEETQQIWSQSPQFPCMEHTDPHSPSTNYVNLISSLPRKAASIITQRRTSHAPLTKYLFRIGKASSPICPICQQSPETIQHFIFHCPAHHQARQALCYKLEGNSISMKPLLTRPKPLKALSKYIAHTKRFTRPCTSNNAIVNPQT